MKEILTYEQQEAEVRRYINKNLSVFQVCNHFDIKLERTKNKRDKNSYNLKNVEDSKLYRYTGYALHKGSDNPNGFNIFYITTFTNENTGKEITVNDWRFKDFTRANLSGGSYDLIKYLLKERDPDEEKIVDFNEVAEVAEKISKKDIKKTLSDVAVDSGLQNKLANLSNKILNYNNNIFDTRCKQAEKALNKLLERGYPESFIKNKGIGFNPYKSDFYEYDGQTIFPIKDNFNNVVSFIYYPHYNEDASEKNKKNKYLFDIALTPETYQRNVFYNMDSIGNHKEVYVVEGVCDSDIVLIEALENEKNNNIKADIGAVTTSGNYTGAYKFINTLLPLIKDKEITLVFDNDETGRGYYSEFTQNLMDYGIINFNVAIVPKHDDLSIREAYELHFEDTEKENHTYKDINDYYIKNKDLAGIRNLKVHGLYYYALDCKYNENKSLKDFEDYLRRKSRFYNQTELLMILDNLKENKVISNTLFELYKKIVYKPINQGLIRKDITKNHILKYHKGLGFMEFDKVWENKSVATIDNYIRKSLGVNYEDGSLLPKIRRLIESEVSIENPDIFNKSNVMVFKNGTLNLETGEFDDKFNPKDYVTNRVTYEYDSKAYSTKWTQFLKEVCEVKNDPEETYKKMSLLQEYAGYILFPDCRMKKMLVLYGEGNNGKSLFLSIMEDLFKDGNHNKAISHVAISDLNKNFHAIHLKDSLLNVSGEAKTSLMGSEERLKEITAEDTISDSYKGKDRIDFIPRCKLMVAANNELRPKDTSNGLWDRFLFVKFLICFKNNPMGDYEKKINRNLYNELKKELPGIFNWCYEGYKRLKENNKFTETKENIETLEDHKDNASSVRQFIKTSNAFSDFVERVMFSGKYEPLSTTVFPRYKEFCWNSNVEPLSSRNFGKEFSKTLDQLGFTYDVKRVKGGNGYSRIMYPDNWEI